MYDDIEKEYPKFLFGLIKESSLDFEDKNIASMILGQNIICFQMKNIQIKITTIRSLKQFMI